MKQASLAILLASATFASVVATSSLTALGQTPGEPSYTEEQSARGEKEYTKSCSFCHADPSMAPALQGDVFLKNWSDQTAAALFDKIQMTMPANEPGSLTAPQAADLVAYILKLNHFPAGQSPLPTEAAALGALKLSPK